MKSALNLSHSLTVQDLNLRVRLGCSEAERSVPQDVNASINLQFVSTPSGAESDLLDETLCYAQICELVRVQVESQEFCLVEKVAQVLFEKVSDFVGGKAKVAVEVHKLRPPVERLFGGVKYRIGTFA